MLLERRSDDVSSMPWRVRGRLVSCANNSVGIQSCLTTPRRPAVRPDPNRPWYVRVLDSTGYYDKVATDALLANINFSNYYNKAEMEFIISSIDLVNYYTKN